MCMISTMSFKVHVVVIVSEYVRSVGVSRSQIDFNVLRY